VINQFFQRLFAAQLTAWLWLALLLGSIGGLGFLAFNLLAIQKLFQEFVAFLKDLFAIILPKKPDSAKALIWLSAFSWAVSLLTGPIVQNIIASIGWLFLIPGIHWLLHEEKQLKELLTLGKDKKNGIFLGPWITGALISIYLFTSPNRLPPITFIVWPCLSAIIAALPKFIKSGPTWKKAEVKDRPYLVNLMLINLLFSCWIQLCFSTQNWLNEYPSLAIEDFNNSPVVVSLQPQADANYRGMDILARMESQLTQNLEGQSWSQVERWLLNFDDQVNALGSTVIGQLPQLAENPLWQIGGRVLAGQYNVQLFTTWHGPTADTQPYYLTKTCKISQITPADIAGRTIPFGGNAATPLVGTAKVQCGPVEGPIKGEPGAKTR
jgi:hypothetical protein